MKLRFRTKLFLVQLAFSTLIAVLASGLVYFEMRQLPMRAVGGGLAATVAQAAVQIPGDDVVALSQLEEPISDPRFTHIRDIIRKVRDNLLSQIPGSSGVARDEIVQDYYVMVPMGEPNMGRYVVTRRPEKAGLMKDMSRVPDMMRGMDGLAVGRQMVANDDGDSLSAYAPVRDSSGHVIGVLGMDAGSAVFQSSWRMSALFVLGGFLLGMAVSSIVAWRFAGWLNRPLDQLDSAVQQVARGRLDVRLPPPHSGDEFVTLFRHFNQMVAGLREGAQVKRSLELASRVQRELLPRIDPEIRGYEVAGGAEYCDETGGDYYDYFDLAQHELEAVRIHNVPPGTCWGLAVGDVTGHGITAALLMAWTRAVLRTEAPEYSEDVAGLMQNINRHLVRDTADHVFLTLFYAVLDVRTHRLAWANAGHEPGLLYRASTGTVVQLQSTDIPLGIQHQAFEAGEPVELSPGDVLLVTSDGITQARDRQRRMLGVDGLTEVLARHAAKSASEIREAVIADTRRHIGYESQEDDITLLVLKAV